MNRTFLTRRSNAILQHAHSQPFSDESYHALVRNPVLDHPNEPFVIQLVEETPNVSIEHPAHFLRHDSHRQGVQRLMLVMLGAKPVRESEEIHFVDRVQYLNDGALDDFVLQSGNSDRALPPIRLWYVRSLRRTGSERSPLESFGKLSEIFAQILSVFLPCHSVYARLRRTLQSEIGVAETRDFVHMVQKCREPLFLILPCRSTYPLNSVDHTVLELCPVRGGFE